MGHSSEKNGGVRLVAGIVADLPLHPLSGTVESLDNTVSLFSQKTVPVCFTLESFCIADDDEPMLGSSDADIDPVLLLHKTARAGPHHGHEDQIKFSTLRAINREYLVFNLIFSKVLCNGMLLSVVGSNNIDTVLCEMLNHKLLISLVELN